MVKAEDGQKQPSSIFKAACLYYEDQAAELKKEDIPAYTLKVTKGILVQYIIN